MEAFPPCSAGLAAHVLPDCFLSAIDGLLACQNLFACSTLVVHVCIMRAAPLRVANADSPNLERQRCRWQVT